MTDFPNDRGYDAKAVAECEDKMRKLEVGELVKIIANSNYYPWLFEKVGEIVAICQQGRKKAYIVQCKKPMTFGVFERNEIKPLDETHNHK